MTASTQAPLLDTATVAVRDLVCDGGGSHACPHGWEGTTHLVFPYRGTYVRWRGDALAVAEAGQVLFFNARDEYRFVHPVAGGDGSLAVRVEEAMLRELAPKALLRDSDALAFAHERLRIDARAQALVALLRHSLREDIAESLEAESLALTLVTRSLGPRTAHAARATAGRQRLVDRAKLVLASDLSRRWSLAEIAAAVGVSAVYLTQVFSKSKACRFIAISCESGLRVRSICSPSTTISASSVRISAFRATAISARRFSRRMAARQPSSVAMRCSGELLKISTAPGVDAWLNRVVGSAPAQRGE